MITITITGKQGEGKSVLAKQIEELCKSQEKFRRKPYSKYGVRVFDNGIPSSLEDINGGSVAIIVEPNYSLTFKRKIHFPSYKISIRRT